MKIAVIGGGASGLTAAIAAARNGAEVTICEKLNRVGKKILATGNGRCNYTNMNLSKECYHSNNLNFVDEVMKFFNLDKTLVFFEDLGILPYVDESGKVYPNSLQASSVLDVLRYELKRHKVKEVTDFNVTALRKSKDKFSIIGNDTITADRVILATGGKASPQLGSDGKGYELAKSLGHEIIEPFPALVQLKLSGKYFKRIAGIKFDGIVKAYAGDRLIREEEGEILFTDYGISGPPILQVSRKVIEELNKKNKPFLNIDMFPGYSKLKLYDILQDRFRRINYKTIEESMIGFINKKLIPVVFYEAGFEDLNKICGKLNKKEIYKIIEILKEWKFEVIGHNSWQQAQSTAGGIKLSEVNPKTLESLKVKGLYFAGEILDVDGDCGGFNLQWAWSSGYTAGYFSSLE
ncbi:MAG: NAD(P)/FAD-dependent oxidoreductase [Tissierellia bacterium]|jgi:predicted Rossmann fold flavoprotein|nr:NAD(P)/FAD-dependent oxidoreductase [Sedimentibacter sp.]NLA13863.1 NAD(P)/FAD-dependent oxidoreductase [Tissierellia bacterium]HAS92386.1 aminoacetone oxidase family FAD-binding enzyme [Clostridiales bacterium]HOA19554.1 NAD(P)/FAD-dependent oxidoreductase [Sedimentibacter sp.]